MYQKVEPCPDGMEDPNGDITHIFCETCGESGSATTPITLAEILEDGVKMWGVYVPHAEYPLCIRMKEFLAWEDAPRAYMGNYPDTTTVKQLKEKGLICRPVIVMPMEEK